MKDGDPLTAEETLVLAQESAVWLHGKMGDLETRLAQVRSNLAVRMAEKYTSAHELETLTANKRRELIAVLELVVLSLREV